MIEIPKDNFYQGYSLSSDINRTGKEHSEHIKQSLKKYGVTPTPKILQLSLKTLQLIHKNTRKHTKIEQKLRLKVLRKKKIVGDVIPIDVTLAEEIFQMLMDRIDPYYTAALIILGLRKKILQLLNKTKIKEDVFDKQTKKALKKILSKDKENLILKNTIEIHIHNDKIKSKKKTRKKKKVKYKHIKKNKKSK